MIIRHHADEALELFLGRGAREVLNRCHFVRERRSAVWADVVTQELDPGSTEHALVGVQVDTIRVQSLQHESQMSEMLLRRSTGHQNVVDIDKAPGAAAQHLVHKALKRLAGVAEPVRHAYPLPKSER